MNIGVRRNVDGAWVKQFNSLFVVLNEKHEVATWKLSKREQFDVVRELLENLRDWQSLNKEVQFFIIDNCCNMAQENSRGIWRKYKGTSGFVSCDTKTYKNDNQGSFLSS